MEKMKLPYIYNDLLKTGPLYDRFDSYMYFIFIEMDFCLPRVRLM